MTRRQRVCVAVVATSLLSVSAAVSAALSGAKDAHVGFAASGTMGMKFEGSTSDLSVSEDGGNVVIDVPLSNLKTGIDLRDRHMKDKYLEIGKFPSATLLVARSALTLPAAGASFEGDVPGTLKLHGQARPVTVHYDAKSDGAGYAAHGRFHINMNDFGVTVPVYLGVTVKPDVDVTASFHVAAG